jgi:hypothetical protein
LILPDYFSGVSLGFGREVWNLKRKGQNSCGARHILIAVIIVQSIFGGSARAANWVEKSVWLFGPRYDGVLPPCEAALDAISWRFAQKEKEFWHSDLEISGFEKVREIAFRPWAPHTIPRRFCTAQAIVTDGRIHPVYYWIGEDTGEIGAIWGVEWCVVGLDRNWAYNPACKMAAP